MTRRKLLYSLPVSIALSAQGKYSGPRPPKQDLPYLLEAQRLIPTEMVEATTSTSNEGKVYSVAGTTSTARTPLPEPIFLLLRDKISVERMRLYRFEVKEGRRVVVLAKHRSEEDQELRITLRPLESALFRIEAAQMLDRGEYSLSPEGGNLVFCFTVY